MTKRVLKDGKATGMIGKTGQGGTTFTKTMELTCSFGRTSTMVHVGGEKIGIPHINGVMMLRTQRDMMVKIIGQNGGVCAKEGLEIFYVANQTKK